MVNEYERKLDGITERLDFLGPKVVDMAERVKKLEVPMAEVKIEQIPFAYRLTAAGTPTSGVTLTEDAPFSGYIRQVTPHWPDGCDGLVDMRVGHGVVQFCPREGYLALNNTTPTYPFNIKVKQGDDIWVELRNRSLFPHNITVTVALEETD